MSKKILLSLVDFQILEVVFHDEGNTYHYLWPKHNHEELKEGDHVIVPNGSSYKPGMDFAVVKVIDVMEGDPDDLQDHINYKWAVAKVDASRYETWTEKIKGLEKRIKAAKRKKQVSKTLEELGTTVEELMKDF